MIKIREKDAMLIFANLIMFFSTISWITLDYIASSAQVLASITELEGTLVVITLLRAFAAMAIVIATVLTLGLDAWFLYRMFNEWRKDYWRENL